MYSQEHRKDIVDEICERIAKGESLRSVLEKEGMPSSKTFFEWVDSDEEKVKQYARACEERADSIFEDILDIADDSESDTYETDDGRVVVNQEHIQRSRLRVDARKWMLGKMQPKKYGEKIQQEISGKDGEPLMVNIIRTYEADQKADNSD